MSLGAFFLVVSIIIALIRFVSLFFVSLFDLCLTHLISCVMPDNKQPIYVDYAAGKVALELSKDD
jgi:hypothetical protein